MPGRPGPKPQKKIKTSSEASRKLAAIASQIRAHADFVDELAKAVVETNATGFALMTGNVDFALDKIRGFCMTQVIQKIISAGYGNATLDARVLSKLMLEYGKLAESNEQYDSTK